MISGGGFDPQSYNDYSHENDALKKEVERLRGCVLCLLQQRAPGESCMDCENYKRIKT